MKIKLSSVFIITGGLIVGAFSATESQAAILKDPIPSLNGGAAFLTFEANNDPSNSFARLVINQPSKDTGEGLINFSLASPITKMGSLEGWNYIVTISEGVRTDVLNPSLPADSVSITGYIRHEKGLHGEGVGLWLDFNFEFNGVFLPGLPTQRACRPNLVHQHRNHGDVNTDCTFNLFYYNSLGRELTGYQSVVTYTHICCPIHNSLPQTNWYAKFNPLNLMAGLFSLIEQPAFAAETCNVCSKVPEPTSIVSFLAFGLLGAVSALKSKLSKSANQEV